jgi:hypothetical protein
MAMLTAPGSSSKALVVFGFELGRRAFEFLAYSTSALCEHSVWFVFLFRDPVEGYVTSAVIPR